MLMNAHHRCVDHLHRHVMRSCQCIHDVFPDTSLPPTNEPIVAGGTRTVNFRKISPWRTRAQHPEYAIENASIIDAWHAARFSWEHRGNDAPLFLGKLISH